MIPYLFVPAGVSAFSRNVCCASWVWDDMLGRMEKSCPQPAELQSQTEFKPSPAEPVDCGVAPLELPLLCGTDGEADGSCGTALPEVDRANLDPPAGAALEIVDFAGPAPAPVAEKPRGLLRRAFGAVFRFVTWL